MSFIINMAYYEMSTVIIASLPYVPYCTVLVQKLKWVKSALCPFKGKFMLKSTCSKKNLKNIVNIPCFPRAEMTACHITSLM